MSSKRVVFAFDERSLVNEADLPPVPPLMVTIKPDARIAELESEVARLRSEIAMHQRSVALWREIAESEHGELAERLVHAERRCSMTRFLLFSAWLKLGEAMKKIAALEGGMML